MKSSREPYKAPILIRHGTLEELTAGSKAHQASTDQQSTPQTS